MTSLTPSEKWRGNPPQANHQPDPVKLVDYDEEIAAQIGSIETEQATHAGQIEASATEIGSLGVEQTSQGGRITNLEAVQFAADPIYADTATGLGATSEGDQFKVENADPDVAYDVFRHDSGPTATPIARYPSAAVAMRAEAYARNQATANVIDRPIAAINAGDLFSRGFEETGPLEVRQITYWSTGDYQKYLSTVTDVAYGTIVKTIEASWNAEITTYSQYGIFYLRLDDDGRALYVLLNAQGSGTIEYGVAEDVDGAIARTTVFNDTTAIPYATSDLGFDNAVTDGDEWTVGVDKFDLYVKYNGTEISRMKNMAVLHPVRGKHAVGNPATGYGFRDLTVRMNDDGESRPDDLVFSLTDAGFKNISAVGTIAASTDQLVLQTNPGFAVGDEVIVEIGGETGSGRRGSMGVGGSWPTLSYADKATMDADTGQADNALSWTEDTGDVYQYIASVWTKISAGSYYFAKAVPQSLVAKITDISGTTLTLDTTATVAATDATVYFSNSSDAHQRILGDMSSGGWTTAYEKLPAGLTIEIPIGKWACGRMLDFLSPYRDEWQVIGYGSNNSVFRSVKGCENAGIKKQVHNAVLRGVGVHGNVKKHGFGFLQTEMDLAVQTSLPSGADLYSGFVCENHDGARWDDLVVWDAFYFFLFNQSDGSHGENCWAMFTEGHEQYIQWALLPANCEGSGFEKSGVISPKMVTGAELFKCGGKSYLRDITLKNASMGANSSGDWEIENPVIEVDQFSGHTNFSKSNPLININTNIQPPHADLALGGTISNPRIIQRGSQDQKTTRSFDGIVINANNVNVSVIGTYDGTNEAHDDLIVAPGAEAGSTDTLNGSVGVRSTADGTLVKNILVAGKSPNEINTIGDANIQVSGAGSQVVDCVADDVVVSGGATETGTRSIASYADGP